MGSRLKHHIGGLVRRAALDGGQDYHREPVFAAAGGIVRDPDREGRGGLEPPPF
jgi:hypothetical protein